MDLNALNSVAPVFACSFHDVPMRTMANTRAARRSVQGHSHQNATRPLSKAEAVRSTRSLRLRSLDTRGFMLRQSSARIRMFCCRRVGAEEPQSPYFLERY